MDGCVPTHDRTNKGSADGRGDAGPTSGPQRPAGRIEDERELLVGELGVEHERDEAEREHRRRRDEHEEARCGARQDTVTAVSCLRSVGRGALSFGLGWMGANGGWVRRWDGGNEGTGIDGRQTVRNSNGDRCLQKDVERRAIKDDICACAITISGSLGGKLKVDVLALTENDPDDEVAVCGRLLSLIELQQERGSLIRHIQLELGRVKRLLVF